jgi:hypothetical protein
MPVCLNCLTEVDLSNRRLPYVCACGGVFRTDGKFRMPNPQAVRPREHDKDGNLVALTSEQIAEREVANKIRKEVQGRKAWEAIHSFVGDDPEKFLLEVFETLIPSYGCLCKADYHEYKRNHPPDFSSPEAFFLWGVNLHNWVNFKLIEAGDTAKRVVPLEESREIWNRPEP